MVQMIQSAIVNLGLIGFGNFGQFAAKHLRQRMNLVVWDARDLRKKAAAVGVRWGSMQEAASQESVLLAVPVSELATCLDSVAPHLSPGSLLMDACSVKVKPIEWMLSAAPEDVEVLGTHALFGPQSGRNGVAGLKVVLCPARTRRTEFVKRFLEEMGLLVEIVSPQEHDRAMAATQALAQFVGRGLIQSGIRDNELKTPTFDRLLKLADTLRMDAPELFQDMHRLNPFAAQERRRFLDALFRLNSELEALEEDV